MKPGPSISGDHRVCLLVTFSTLAIDLLRPYLTQQIQQRSPQKPRAQGFVFGRVWFSMVQQYLPLLLLALPLDKTHHGPGTPSQHAWWCTWGSQTFANVIWKRASSGLSAHFMSFSCNHWLCPACLARVVFHILVVTWQNIIARPISKHSTRESSRGCRQNERTRLHGFYEHHSSGASWIRGRLIRWVDSTTWLMQPACGRVL